MTLRQIRAELAETIIKLNAIGNIRTPASNAVYPNTDCRYWLRKNIDPNMLNITSASAEFAPVKDMFLKK